MFEGNIKRRLKELEACVEDGRASYLELKKLLEASNPASSPFALESARLAGLVREAGMKAVARELLAFGQAHGEDALWQVALALSEITDAEGLRALFAVARRDILAASLTRAGRAVVDLPVLRAFNVQATRKLELAHDVTAAHLGPLMAGLIDTANDGERKVLLKQLERGDAGESGENDPYKTGGARWRRAWVESLLFPFEALAQLSDKGVEAVLASSRKEDVTLALANAPEEVRARFLAVCSPKARKLLADELTAAARIVTTEAEDTARERLLYTTRRLAAAAIIDPPGGLLPRQGY